MITDAIIEAIDLMIENCKNEEQAAGMEKVKNMLADFDEETWEDIGSQEKGEWVTQYIAE